MICLQIKERRKVANSTTSQTPQSVCRGSAPHHPILPESQKPPLSKANLSSLVHAFAHRNTLDAISAVECATWPLEQQVCAILSVFGAVVYVRSRTIDNCIIRKRAGQQGSEAIAASWCGDGEEEKKASVAVQRYWEWCARNVS